MLNKRNNIVFLIFIGTLLVACGKTANHASTSWVEQKYQVSSEPIQFGKHVDIFISEGVSVTRHAVLYIPNGMLNTRTPPPPMLPLVLAFHAYGESISNFETLTGFDALANTEDFIVAYPEGLPDPKITTKTLPHWDTEPGSMDVKFIRDLVTAIEGGGYNVDPTRIYATGFSNGGGMVNRVGCDLSGIVAAIAPVEGGYGEPDWAICNPVFPVAVMAIHGIPDSTVPYYGGVSKKDGAAGIDFPDIPDWAAAWALRDSCNRVPIVSTYNSDIITTEYPNCHWSYSVILYSIDNNDHYWPGSSTLGASQAINATAEIWNFFSKWQSLA